jgi:hypothetical protein
VEGGESRQRIYIRVSFQMEITIRDQFLARQFAKVSTIGVLKFKPFKANKQVYIHFLRAYKSIRMHILILTLRNKRNSFNTLSTIS